MNFPIPASAILLIHCPDQTGLVASITKFIGKYNGNILYLDQHVDLENKIFFMRIEWDLNNFMIPMEAIGNEFDEVIGKRFGMIWELYFSDSTQRMAVFASELPHCLYDILTRCHSAEWKVDVPLIVSNHTTLKNVADKFDIPFHVFSITNQNKSEQEKQELSLLKKYDIDFIVLARYMQILSEDFINVFPNRIINIHHSFLPAFPGAKPYHSAYQRGVKIIGSTSHFVSSELDGGPIIEQDVVHINHTDSVSDLIRKGRDLEKIVLSRAIWKYLQRKTLIYNNRTIIFA